MRVSIVLVFPWVVALVRRLPPFAAIAMLLARPGAARDGRRLATSRRIVLAAAWFALSCGGAAAQDPAAFFKGRTLRIVVGFGPGGGYDFYARLVAKYLGVHI